MKAEAEAAALAWQAAERRLDAVKRALGRREARLEQVRYDAVSSISRIDELPDRPKSPDPKIPVSVTLELVYHVVR